MSDLATLKAWSESVLAGKQEFTEAFVRNHARLTLQALPAARLGFAALALDDAVRDHIRARRFDGEPETTGGMGRLNLHDDVDAAFKALRLALKADGGA